MNGEPDQITRSPDGRPEAEQPRWRKDFPIDWPRDHYVARRDFTKFMVLTSAAFAVGQLWIAIQSLFRRRRARPPRTQVAVLDDIPVGGSVVFSYPDEHDKCILVRTANYSVLAYSQECTHLSCAVVPRIERECFECPCHEGVFDLVTGRPLEGPPRRPLPRVDLEVDRGVVYAVGVERRSV